MKFTGKLKGNFIAIADKSGHAKSNTSFQYKITELRKISIISAKNIDDQAYHILFNKSIAIKNEKNEVQKIDTPIDLPFQEGIQNAKGINPLRLSNIKLESTKKISKGYYFHFLKGIRILDSILALGLNVLLFIPSLLLPKLIKPFSDEIYFGKIEADFVGDYTSSVNQDTDLNFNSNEQVILNEIGEADYDSNTEVKL